MDYFLLKQSSQIDINQEEIIEAEEATICKLVDITFAGKMDYIAKGSLISNRLKILLESYLPKNLWKPYVFTDTTRNGQEVFWYLCSQEYIPEKVELSPTGLITEIQVDILKVPRIFKVKQKYGKIYNVVHLSVTESMLRRRILGLELVPVSISTTQ